jgi:hypothetical protein
MYPLNQLKTLVSCGRDPARSLPLRRGFLLIPLILVSFALCQQTQAAPGPETPDPGSVATTNTADGASALSGVTGFYNSAFGFLSLLSNGASSFNTGVGAGTLLLNTAIENTAVGVGTLLSNTTGVNNTGCGAFALFTNSTGDVGTGSFNCAVGANSLLLNVDGDANNALGESALFNNVHGAANTALGDVALSTNDVSTLGLGNANTAVGAGALFSNNDGDSNNAVGFNALGSNADGLQNNVLGFDAMADNISGSGNVAIGDSAGAGVEGSFNIYIGWQVTPGANEDNTIRIGDTSDAACFIGGISGVPVTGDLVAVDTNGQLGSAVDAGGGKLSVKQLLQQQQLVQALKATTERQAAVIALQEGQIKTLTAGLKQQADQIQKVSAQLEMIRPTPRVVENR